MTENNAPNEKQRFRIGTVEGTALVLGVMLVIIIFFRILPELQRFHDYISNDTQKLQEAVVSLKAEQERLAKQICTSNFDQEINELKSALFVLKELETKGEAPIKEQTQTTIQEIEKLMDLLKVETPK